MKRGIVLFGLGLFSFLGCSGNTPRDLELANIYETSIDHIFTNLANPSVKPGAVIASPSQSNPDYFSHWIRDAALTENALYHVYLKTHSEELKKKLLAQAKQWILFEIDAQNNALSATAGIGEPRFNVDGTVVTYPWGRPQDDGPAIRAFSTMQWAELLAKNGEIDFVRAKLYGNGADFLNRDLEYIKSRWEKESSFDLWEETMGKHFFTRVVQLLAFKKAQEFATFMNDSTNAKNYSVLVKNIRASLNNFIVEKRDYITATIDWVGTNEKKKTQLDSSILIAANHGLFDDNFLKEKISYFLNGASQLESFFKDAYTINKNSKGAAALGRYPEDDYTGVSNAGPANPWFITTHAAAEFYCKLAQAEIKLGHKKSALNYLAKGRSFFDFTLLYKGAGNQMSEQYSRENGSLVGANNLTWSYASFITAYLACYP